ncbi:MAG: hypothetical protein AAGC64_04550 [Bacteroidota bacterium]
MKKYIFLVFSVMLFIVGCSTDNTDSESPPDNGDNIEDPDNGNTASKTPSTDLSKLWIGNIAIAGADGNVIESVKIMRQKVATRYGNERLRSEANIPDSLGFLSISAGTYYTDGSNPTEENDVYDMYSLGDNHPNITFTVLQSDEDNAHGYLTIEKPLTIETQGFIINGDGFARKITDGTLKITTKEGFDFNGYSEFELNRENINGNKFGHLIFGSAEISELDFDYNYVRQELSKDGAIIPIQFAEVASDNENNERKQYLPLLDTVIVR